MNKALNLHKNLGIFGIPFLCIGILVLIAKSSLFTSNPDVLSIGITIDLLLIVPMAYFLLIRKSSIPKTTVFPFLILGMIIGSIILPPQNQYYLNLFKTWIFPIIEISALAFVMYKVGKAIKLYKHKQNSSHDFYTTLKNTCYEILPKGVVILLVTEISVFYYGFIDWKKRKLKENEFSYHKESGTVSLLIVILFLVAIETFVLHILLARWSEIAAWILTFLSLYSAFQLFGFLKSMYKRPISIEQGRLHLRYGIMNETTIELSKIDAMEFTTQDIEFNKETRSLSFFGALESHNLIIRMKEENTLLGIYGIKRGYKNLALHVDDKTRFENQINKALQDHI